MRVLFLGDIVGEAGRDAVRAAIPELIKEKAPDFIVVNGENSAGGNGITPRLTYELLRAKVDVVTLGDHCWDQREIYSFFEEEPRLIRPINFPAGCPGKGSVVVSGNGKKLGVLNALGRTFMPVQTEHPLPLLEAEIKKMREETNCILLDFHCEATSEKICVGHALDGSISAMVGTHTHVQTADEKILMGGTAYITDVGFCGGHDSVIGRDKYAIMQRYRNQMPIRMSISSAQLQVDGVCIEIDEDTGKATGIERIQMGVDLSLVDEKED